MSNFNVWEEILPSMKAQNPSSVRNCYIVFLFVCSLVVVIETFCGWTADYYEPLSANSFCLLPDLFPLTDHPFYTLYFGLLFQELSSQFAY